MAEVFEPGSISLVYTVSGRQCALIKNAPSSSILQFNDPLIILLLVSAFVSVCTKQFDDAFSITVVSAKQCCVWAINTLAVILEMQVMDS